MPAASGPFDPAPDGESAPVSLHQRAASREEFGRLLEDIRSQGQISISDEAAILREYDEMLVELRGAKQRLEVEYRERIGRDGQADADAWLRGEAEALGRRQGEQLKRLVGTIPALAPQPAAGG
ncbi:hypothetical protein QF205_07830 [Luteimonas composti]|uniref:Uncharacterized protein n=1 Tax=Luteimonas composti TaxID=398257 RepID=A0ABT6MQU0_9GAMM|nr:hypothetical protein [Luteimonas composti]MDH7452985.1 hypothetical protein [Luteimonas composti]